MNSALFPDLIINGETIPHKAVAAEAQHHEAPTGKPGIAWRKAANAIAIRTLLLQEARKRDLAVEPTEVGPGRFETEEEALIRGVLDEAIATTRPAASQVRAEWEKDPSRFRSPPLWEVSHILFACDPNDDQAKDKAYARAVALTKAVAESPREFSALATTESDCGSKAHGGTLGQLSPSDTVPEFEAALRNLKEGQITPAPVLSRYGYHIIRLDAAAFGDVLPFDAVRPKIAEAMEKAAWATSARTFINRMVASAEISGADFTAV